MQYPYHVYMLVPHNGQWTKYKMVSAYGRIPFPRNQEIGECFMDERDEYSGITACKNTATAEHSARTAMTRSTDAELPPCDNWKAAILWYEHGVTGRKTIINFARW